MDSNQLFQFRAIVETGSITKASQALFISQPALSIALNRLESEIDCKLFNRVGKKLVLTEGGRQLYEYAKISTDAILEAEKYFSNAEISRKIHLYRIGGINYPLISTGCNSIPDRYLAPKLVANSELITLAESKEADIILADTRYLDADIEGFTCDFLYHQALLLSVEKDDPLADADTVDIRSLSARPIVSRASVSGFNSWINEIKRVNRITLREEASMDSTTWVAEGDRVKLPYLMNNFGISTVWNVVQNRTILPVVGKYTQRDIYIWYQTEKETQLRLIVNKIKENVSMIYQKDQEFFDSQR